MRKTLYLAAVLLCSTSAFALDVPQPGTADPHMRTVAYNSNNLTEINISEGRSSVIEINPNECIKWDFFGQDSGPVRGPDPDKLKTPMYHTMPLFGKTVGTTNLNLVSVDCDDQKVEHTYALLVHVVPESKDAETTTRLRYTYAAQEKQAIAAAAAVNWKAKREQIEHEKVLSRLAVEPFYQGPQGRNYRYIVIGDNSITPVVNGGSSDNYAQAAFRFPGNMEIPAILVADGGPTAGMCALKEKPSYALLHSPEHTTHVRPQDDWQVVPVAEHWRLRLGNGPSGKAADIFSCGYDPVGYNPGTGTPSPDVIRMPADAKRVSASR